MAFSKSPLVFLAFPVAFLFHYSVYWKLIAQVSREAAQSVGFLSPGKALGPAPGLLCVSEGPPPRVGVPRTPLGGMVASLWSGAPSRQVTSQERRPGRCPLCTLRLPCELWTSSANGTRRPSDSPAFFFASEPLEGVTLPEASLSPLLLDPAARPLRCESAVTRQTCPVHSVGPRRTASFTGETPRLPFRSLLAVPRLRTL